MKNTFKIIYVAILITVFVSCEKRTDFYGDENIAPSISISSVNNSWSQSDDYFYIINDSLKKGNDYALAFRHFDNLGKQKIKVSQPSQGKFYLWGDEIDYDTFFIHNKNYDMFSYVNNDSLITEHITLSVIDPYDREGSCILNLTVFDNLLPYANFQINSLDNLNPLEYEIDASSSFDSDLKYGGGLINYEYVVDNDTTYDPYNKMNYIFPEVRNYVVSVRAMDNDSVWSDFVTIADFQP